jgi:DNA-binding LacI/PurR family transcriptional regulator
MATIVDVASAAGVSVATVSRVLNGKCSLEGESAKRVLLAVKELQYVPNPTARNLRRNESRIILILVPNITNPYYAHILSGIGDAAHQHGYGAFLCNTGGDADQEAQVLGRLTRRQADGAILLATALGSDWLRPYAQRYPIVQCSEYDPGVEIPHVTVDNYKAALEVMAYLHKLGHTRVGIVSSKNQYSSTSLRMRGYRDALKAAGLPVREEYIRCAAADYTFKSGFDAARSLLSQEQRPTALFCISDMLALGAIASAKEMGFRVPEDVTVVGFDDVEHTTMFHPYVTTMVQPCYDIGFQAMEMLDRLLHRQEVPAERLLPHRLVVRESSAPRQRNILDFTACVTSR